MCSYLTWVNMRNVLKYCAAIAATCAFSLTIAILFKDHIPHPKWLDLKPVHSEASSGAIFNSVDEFNAISRTSLTLERFDNWSIKFRTITSSKGCSPAELASINHAIDTERELIVECERAHSRGTDRGFLYEGDLQQELAKLSPERLAQVFPCFDLRRRLWISNSRYPTNIYQPAAALTFLTLDLQQALDGFRAKIAGNSIGNRFGEQNHFQ